MAPYIAALVILIVVILFSVYHGIDGFTNPFADTTTFQQFMETLKAAQEANKVLKEKIDTSAEFDDNLTLPKLREMGFDRAPGEKPFSKALSVQMETDGIAIRGMIQMFETALNAGTIKPTDLLKEVRTKNVQVESVANVVPRIQSVIEKRKSYIASKATAPPTTTSTGTTASTTSTASTAAIDMNDLYSAITGTKEAIESSTVPSGTSSKPPRSSVNSIFGTAPSQTAASTKEMEERIAKSVATQLKDSLLAKRSTENVVDDMACPYSKYDSNAVDQGQEYRQAHPDMSEYIRKDSIPCWNCSLP